MGGALHSKYGEGAGVKQQRTGRLSLREWFQRMEIEQFQRILLYDEEKLCLEFRRGRFTVYGDGMRIETLAAHRITLRGIFLRTEFSSS